VGERLAVWNLIFCKTIFGQSPSLAAAARLAGEKVNFVFKKRLHRFLNTKNLL
jgi:hypothetical protein